MHMHLRAERDSRCLRRPTRPCRPAKRTRRWHCFNPLPQSDAMPGRGAQPRVPRAAIRWSSGMQPSTKCEQAVRLDGQNSDYHLWLGRALGEKADRASFLSAYSLAKRVRAEFEEAVRLNPRNAEALARPGRVLLCRRPEWWAAASTRRRRSPRSWIRWIRRAPTNCAAEIAEQQQGLRHGRAGVQAGDCGRQRIRLLSGCRWPASIAAASAGRRWKSAVHSGADGRATRQGDKRAGVALYDGAALLIETNRDPALAAKMLEDYLAGPQRPRKRRRLWRTCGWRG